MITGRDLGMPLASLPHILGHENAGIVKAIGDGFKVLRLETRCSVIRSSQTGSLVERYGIDSQANQRITPN